MQARIAGPRLPGLPERLPPCSRRVSRSRRLRGLRPDRPAQAGSASRGSRPAWPPGGRSRLPRTSQSAPRRAFLLCIPAADAARSSGGGAGLVSIVARDLRYPRDWPRGQAQEKGIDVALAVDLVMTVRARECDIGIVFSSDTDLVPALEAVLSVRPGELPVCEIAAWAPGAGRPRSLAVRGVHLRRHLLAEADFRAVADSRGLHAWSVTLASLVARTVRLLRFPVAPCWRATRTSSTAPSGMVGSDRQSGAVRHAGFRGHARSRNRRRP